MNTQSAQSADPKWQCHKCRRDMVIGPVSVSYMGNRFIIDLPHCPGCGLVLITEDMAMGKMAEAERIMEDK